MEKRRITQNVVELFGDTGEQSGNLYVMRDRIVIMDSHYLKEFVASMQDMNTLIIENKKGATNSENVD
jgi:hypothetical protein